MTKPWTCPLDSEKAKKILFEASRLRVPHFRRTTEGDKPPHNSNDKVRLLEEWAVDAARWRSFLEEARLWMDEASHMLTLRWTSLEGWEENLPEGKRRKDATKDDITHAKRLADPDLHSSLSNAKHLVSQLSAQIRRIEKDEERVSRLYTFITGAS